MAKTEGEGAGRSLPGDFYKSGRVQPTDDDVTGHARLLATEDNEDQDTEGHRAQKASDEESDTEGHRAQKASGDEDDTEGHNLFQSSDYYVQTRTGRQQDVDREARQRALVKEARENKPTKR